VAEQAAAATAAAETAADAAEEASAKRQKKEDASRPSFYAAQKPMSGRQKSQSGSRNPAAWR
jgi:hypothetical protein